MKLATTCLALLCVLAAPTSPQQQTGSTSETFATIFEYLCAYRPTDVAAVEQIMSGRHMEHLTDRPGFGPNAWTVSDSFGTVDVWVMPAIKMAGADYTPRRMAALPAPILSSILDTKNTVDYTLRPGLIVVTIPAWHALQDTCTFSDEVVIRLRDGAWVRTHRNFQWK